MRDHQLKKRIEKMQQERYHENEEQRIVMMKQMAEQRLKAKV
jgi:hypothetical protein